MREKKPYVILTFKTTTQAMAMEKWCQESNVPGRMIPVPTKISAGCGLAWRMPSESFPIYIEEIKNAGLFFEGQWELML